MTRRDSRKLQNDKEQRHSTTLISVENDEEAEIENFKDLYRNPNLSHWKKFKQTVRILSLFKHDNGIFHRGNTQHTTKCSLTISTIILILVGFVMYYKFKSFNTMEHI